MTPVLQGWWGAPRSTPQLRIDRSTVVSEPDLSNGRWTLAMGVAQGTAIPKIPWNATVQDASQLKRWRLMAHRANLGLRRQARFAGLQRPTNRRGSIPSPREAFLTDIFAARPLALGGL